MQKIRTTGKRLHRSAIEFIKCIDGHVAPHETKALLAGNSYCPFCNVLITLSDAEQAYLAGTRTD